MLNQLFHLLLRIRLRLNEATSELNHHGMLLWAVGIGVLGGICSALFREANIGLKWLLTGHSGDIVTIAAGLSPELRILIPTLGGVLSGCVLVVGTRLFPGLKSQDYLEVIRLGDGVITVRSTASRVFSSLISISSGASIGREGGMVQLSAMAASAVGRFFRISRPRLRLLVACGGAAGMASAYNTPLGGAIFIAEIVLQSLAIEALGPLVVASVTATLVIRHWIGMRPIFSSPDFTAAVEVDIVAVLGLGLLAGLLAPAFLSLLDASRWFFQKLKLPLPISLGTGGLILGVISIYIPEVWGNGHAVVESLLNGSPVLGWVAIMLVLKIVATSAAVGSGTVGGVFTPSLLTGAAIGWLYCQGIGFLSPGSPQDEVTFAALGMGAFLAGTTHAPVMAIIMIFEMTLDANLLMPLIIVSISARYLSAAIRPMSVYAKSIGDVKTQLPYLMHVSDVLAPPTITIQIGATAESVSEQFCLSSAHYGWVVDKDTHYQGSISLHTMKRFLGDDSLRHLDAAVVFMDDGLPGIKPDASLTEALAELVRTGADCLPVVGSDGTLLGEITRNDILLTLT